MTISAPEAPPQAAPAAVSTPYVGLRPFSAADTAFFFGRSEERRIVAANACASRLTVLYGPSGVGKSSVLDGGVVYDLAQASRRRSSQAPRYAAVYFREWSKWRSDPIAGVTQAIHDGLRQHYGIQLDPLSADDFAATVHAWMMAQPGGLIVILDQFEEYLLYQDANAHDSFAVQFPRVLEDAELRVNFVLSLREDALGQLDRFKGSVPGLLDNRLPLKLLSRSAAEDAIRKPLDALRQHGTEVTIEDALVEAVLGAEHGVAAGSVKLGHAGEGDLPERAADTDRPIEAPYLQLVMERIWNEERSAGSSVLQLETFRRLGWAQRIVQEHLDARMSKLSPADQDTASKLFRYLVTPSGAKIALSASDLALLAGTTEARVLPVLDGLAQGDARVLRSIAPPNDDLRERRFEIFHDALAHAVLDWTARREKMLDEARVVAAEERFRTERRKKIVARMAALTFAAGVIALLTLQIIQKRRVAAENHARELTAAAERSLEDDPQRGLLLALHAAGLTYRPGKALLPEIDEALHRALQSMQLPTLLFRHTSRLRALAASPDGRLVATSDEAGAVTLWDAASERRTRTLTTNAGFVSALVFSPDSRRLLVASWDSATRIWDVNGQRAPIALRGHNGAVLAAAFHPTLPRVLTGGQDSTARLWDADKGTLVRTYGGNNSHRGEVWAVGFALSGSLVVSGSDDGTSKVWDRQTGELRCTYYGDGHEVFALTPVPPLGDRIASGTRAFHVLIWNPYDCTQLYQLGGHRNSVFAIAASADGHHLATASADATLRVWDAQTGTETSVLRGHTAGVVSAAFSPDGERIYSASDDSTARVWQATPLESEVAVLHPENSSTEFRGTAFNPKRPQLISLVRSPATVLFSNLRNSRASFSYQLANPSEAYALDITPDGQRVVVAGKGGFAVLGTDSGDVVMRVDTSELSQDSLRMSTITAADLSPDGKLLALGDDHGLLNVFNMETHTGRPIRAHTDRITSVAFDAAGERLVTGSDDAKAIVWRISPGLSATDTIRGHDRWVTAVAFSPDGKWIATAGVDRSIMLHAADSVRHTRRLSGHTNTVWSLAFSPDSKRLVSAGMDRTVRVWDAAQFREVLWLPRQRGTVFRAAFSPDGAYIASAGEAGDVRVSVIEPATLLHRAWDEVQRTFTKDECARFAIERCSESSAVAALLNGRRNAEQKKLPEAARQFARAGRLDPTLRGLDTDSMARAVAVNAGIERARRYLSAQRVADAVLEFREARALDAGWTGDVAPELVRKIADLLQTRDSSSVGPILDAYDVVIAADRSYKPTAGTLNLLCWWGTLAGYAQRVGGICESAVEQGGAQYGYIRDSRGVNRASNGNVAGAIEDFQAFIAMPEAAPYRARREGWIRALRAGRNPFTKAELASLRAE